MVRTLVTGMSGAGKSTLLRELARRGHPTIDTDYDGWILPDGLWDEPRITGLLTELDDVIVSGTVENQAKFYRYFAHIVLLSAPVEILIDRVSMRTNNNYGHSPEQQADIRRYVSTVEPLLRTIATWFCQVCILKRRPGGVRSV